LGSNNRVGITTRNSQIQPGEKYAQRKSSGRDSGCRSGIHRFNSGFPGRDRNQGQKGADAQGIDPTSGGGHGKEGHSPDNTNFAKNRGGSEKCYANWKTKGLARFPEKPEGPAQHNALERQPIRV
jgi:hypothetical protein